MILLLLTRLSWSQCPDYTPTRQVFWGDLHVHTHLSTDAAVQGTTTTSEQAYNFAKGNEVEINTLSKSVQLDEALDFVSITDHSEMLGEMEICHSPEREKYSSIACRYYRGGSYNAFLLFNRRLSAKPKSRRDDLPRMWFCGKAGEYCEQVASEVWSDMIEDARKHNEPCEFTVFPGYEWSAMPALKNLHRNVIFENFEVPEQIISYLDAPRDYQLWQTLDEKCQGNCQYMTIPHNSNLSSGTMFPSLDELSKSEEYSEYVASRSEKEPVMELFQHKGSSECLPSEEDPDCAFEYAPYNNLSVDRYGGIFSREPEEQDFLRYALTEGMIIENQGEANPYKYGVIGSTDTHLGIPGAVDEMQFNGHGGAGKVAEGEMGDVPYFNPGGIVAVWAEENTQSSVFQALQRKEVYASSGPRFEVRFFATKEELASECGSKEWLTEAYEKGSPMGGNLEKTEDIFFHIQVKAPQDFPIERIQLIQGWAEDSVHKQSIQTIFQQTKGSESQCFSLQKTVPASSWAYIRVLAKPTKRWSNCEDERPNCPDDIPIDIQERAWSSPIWFYAPE